jgi:hypothetical protein
LKWGIALNFNMVLHGCNIIWFMINNESFP